MMADVIDGQSLVDVDVRAGDGGEARVGCRVIHGSEDGAAILGRPAGTLLALHLHALLHWFVAVSSTSTWWYVGTGFYHEFCSFIHGFARAVGIYSSR